MYSGARICTHPTKGNGDERVCSRFGTEPPWSFELHGAHREGRHYRHPVERLSARGVDAGMDSVPSVRHRVKEMAAVTAHTGSWRPCTARRAPRATRRQPSCRTPNMATANQWPTPRNGPPWTEPRARSRLPRTRPAGAIVGVRKSAVASPIAVDKSASPGCRCRFMLLDKKFGSLTTHRTRSRARFTSRPEAPVRSAMAEEVD